MPRSRTIASLALTAIAAVAAPAGATDLADLVMWAIHDDTHELVQFNFETDTSTLVGVITDQHGHVLDDLEALGYIPSGPNMGFYAVQNSTGCCHQKKLIRIDGLTGVATVFDSGPDVGYTRGMDVFEESPGEWRLYVSITSGSSPKQCRLKTVNPSTITPYDSKEIREVGDYDGDGTTWVVMEGLALDGAGTLFGVSHIGSTQTVLWTINRITGIATPRGTSSWQRIEALQFASGANTPTMTDLPPAAQAWGAAAFANGVLFAFADNDDQFLILNPLTGQGTPAPGSFTSNDVEGLNFMNVNADPYEPVIHAWD